MHTAPYGSLPFPPASFDLVVARDVLRALVPGERAGVVHEIDRVLRPGGRLMVIETVRSGGISGLFAGRGRNEDSAQGGGALTELSNHGFAGVRLLAERGGISFVEGVKRNV
jgi:SAM-dependent methyltransferase